MQYRYYDNASEQYDTTRAPETNRSAISVPSLTWLRQIVSRLCHRVAGPYEERLVALFKPLHPMTKGCVYDARPWQSPRALRGGAGRENGRGWAGWEGSWAG